jgi:hypothetical protein
MEFFGVSADSKDNFVMRRVLFLSIIAGGMCLPSPISAQAQPAPRAAGTTASASPTARAGVRLLPGTRPEALLTIQGSALNSAGAGLPDAIVRLRDARLGRIVDVTKTDKSGSFAFRSVDPGSYVAEVMGPDQAVLAASDLLVANAGDTLSTVVKLPLHRAPLGGALGHSVPSAALVTAGAAAAGILATQVAGSPVSPPG